MTFPSFSAGEVLTATDMNAVGLWKVASGTLSLTTTATNVTGVFSSTYKQYRLLLNVTAKSDTNRVDMRYIVGTTPQTTGYYQAGIGSNYTADSAVYYQRSNNDGYFFGGSTNGLVSISMDIFNANKSGVGTMHQGNVMDRNTGYAFAIGGVNIATSQFTGFQLVTTTGTATVEYQVFGYRD
jgi:hypothetical protein